MDTVIDELLGIQSMKSPGDIQKRTYLPACPKSSSPKEESNRHSKIEQKEVRITQKTREKGKH